MASATTSWAEGGATVLDLDGQISIREVGPRDGLQREAPLDVAHRVRCHLGPARSGTGSALSVAATARTRTGDTFGDVLVPEGEPVSRT